ncbi:hypothetical protein PIROE2DRAFT_4037 [Piromyces sp. E2]|nr:hypothetical protein PIROE2DRAFT_4037 [Piromyces sp. E2]|eukprot:OUM68291.1 hypothetical protein PIROE2DRAFT_4037 [Piromyces sp. E2]
MFKVTIFFALLISLAFCEITDYLKSANRTFNEIDGKIPKVFVEMDPTEYKKLVEMAQIDQYRDIIDRCNGDAGCLEDFETKVTLIFEVDDNKKVYNKVNFKTGGKYGRAQDRIGFNFKLKGDDLLLGRKQIRVRADSGDYTHLRSKIAYDLLNVLGFASIQENHCELYINGEYFGLYLLKDTIKTNWINKVYGLPSDEEIETLYYCTSNVKFNKGEMCGNENKKFANYTQPFEELVDKIQASESIEDLEKFMNVDLLMRNIAIEFLYGSNDHFIISGHNFYMYQKKDGIWDMILVDFDSEFGSGYHTYFKFILHQEYENYGFRLSLEEMKNLKKKPHKILDIICSKDNTYFKKALREIMVTGFNPDALFIRIDELKEFIAPYVKKATTPRADGRLPGVINLLGTNTTHTYEDFEAVSSIENTDPKIPSLKSWILNRFEFACEEYGFNKEEILKEAAIYRGEAVETDTNAEVETEYDDSDDDEKSVEDISVSIDEEEDSSDEEI